MTELRGTAGHPERAEISSLPKELRRTTVPPQVRDWVDDRRAVRTVERAPSDWPARRRRRSTACTSPTARRLVLRRYVWPGFLVDEPIAPQREVDALGSRSARLPVPEAARRRIRCRRRRQRARAVDDVPARSCGRRARPDEACPGRGNDSRHRPRRLRPRLLPLVRELRTGATGRVDPGRVVGDRASALGGGPAGVPTDLHPPRLPSRQRALAARPRVGCRRLAQRVSRPVGLRHRALPSKPGLALGPRGRRRLPPRTKRSPAAPTTTSGSWPRSWSTARRIGRRSNWQRPSRTSSARSPIAHARLAIESLLARRRAVGAGTGGDDGEAGRHPGFECRRGRWRRASPRSSSDAAARLDA